MNDFWTCNMSVDAEVDSVIATDLAEGRICCKRLPLSTYWSGRWQTVIYQICACLKPLLVSPHHTFGQLRSTASPYLIVSEDMLIEF